MTGVGVVFAVSVLFLSPFLLAALAVAVIASIYAWPVQRVIAAMALDVAAAWLIAAMLLLRRGDSANSIVIWCYSWGTAVIVALFAPALLILGVRRLFAARR